MFINLPSAFSNYKLQHKCIINTEHVYDIQIDEMELAIKIFLSTTDGIIVKYFKYETAEDAHSAFSQLLSLLKVVEFSAGNFTNKPLDEESSDSDSNSFDPGPFFG